MRYKFKGFISILLLSSSIYALNAKSTGELDSTIILQSHLDSSISSEANILFAKEILAKYITAIGGENLIRNITDRITDMKGVVQGVETDIMFYQKSPNKLCQKITAGEVEQKTIFNGSRGVKIIGDEKQEIVDDDLVKLSFEAIMNLILDPEIYGVKIQYLGSEKINEKYVFKILLTLPNNTEWLQCYDMETGLKLRDSKDIITPNGKFKQVTEFDNYKNIDGILYPFKIRQYLGNQVLDFTIESLLVNTGISDEIFQID